MSQSDARANDKNDKKNGEPILSQPAHRSTAARMRILVETYAQTGRLNRACEAARVAFKTHYRKLQSDAAYRRAFEESEQQVGQMLEDTALERALAGDSHLLLALLKRFRPQQYRERVEQQVSGSLSVDIVERLQAGRRRMLEMKRDESAAG